MSSRPPARTITLVLLAGLWTGGPAIVCAAEAGPDAVVSPVPVPPASPEATLAIGYALEAQGLLTLGASLTLRNDYAAAEIAYRRILSSTDFTRADQMAAEIGLARTYRLQGSLTKAAAIYEKYLKQYPDDSRVPDVLLDLGRTLRAMGAHRPAIARFYSVINSTLKLPTEGHEHYQLLAKTAQFEIAETHFESGNFAEAGKFFLRLRLLDLAPGDRARAHFKSAYALQLAGDHEGAVTSLRSFLDQWPQDVNVPEARYLLATTLRLLNRPEEALAATLELLRDAQNGMDARRWAYWQRRTGNQLANDFFQSGDTRHALAIYEGLSALSSEPAWRLPITYQIALCHERLRALDRARTAYQDIIDTVARAGAAAAPGTPDEQSLDLARMAAWRLKHMDWSDRTERQLTTFFTTTPPHPVAPAAQPTHP